MYKIRYQYRLFIPKYKFVIKKKGRIFSKYLSKTHTVKKKNIRKIFLILKNYYKLDKLIYLNFY